MKNIEIEGKKLDFFSVIGIDAFENEHRLKFGKIEKK